MVVETVHIRQANVRLYENSDYLDTGSLIISESNVLWEGASKRFYLTYPQITLHAISRPGNSDQTNQCDFPQGHLLFMIDGDRVWNESNVKHASNGDGTSNGTELDDDDDTDRASDCPGTTSILRFVPPDPVMLEVLYKAVADCQVLNPDPEDLDDSDLEDLEEEEEEEEDENMNGGDHCEDEDEPMDSNQFADAC